MELYLYYEKDVQVAMFCQIENTRGIVVRIKQRQRRQISNSTIRKISTTHKILQASNEITEKTVGQMDVIQKRVP